MRRLLNLAYFRMVDGLDREQREEMDEALDDPPPGLDRDGLPVWARGDENIDEDMSDLAGLLTAGVRHPEVP